ncbi:MAG: TIM barrel protein [Candidatus Latescibacteria bacterium]|nr:TIM barrel protein [Candidatus Latescibacterota bacterium]
MKLALMPGDLVPADQLRGLGFEAVQLFFGGSDPAADPSIAAIDARLAAADQTLAAMTLHLDLVGPQGPKPGEVERAIECVGKTAALKDRFGDNDKPILVWHPSGYPEADDIDDRAVFEGLCQALAAVCKTAEQQQVDVAVEITRAGSVGSAETFRHLKDRIGSPALRVCMDLANFAPDRTPVKRAVRMLADDIAIAHGKDSSFADNGEVAHYGPTGTGRLDYETYIKALKEYTDVPYFVFEYYKNREQLLAARDIVRQYL